jgi:hypothetical protein
MPPNSTWRRKGQQIHQPVAKKNDRGGVDLPLQMCQMQVIKVKMRSLAHSLTMA